MTPGKEYKFTYTRKKGREKKGIQHIKYTPENPTCSSIAPANKVVLQSEPYQTPS
jgi:hypothetical protein